MNNIIALQNQSAMPNNLPPTIVIKVGDAEWESAYKNWLSGKSPTDSPEWKKGCFAIVKLN